VTPDTGFFLDIGPRPQIVQALRRTIETIAADPTSLLQKITAGQQRVKSSFTWQTKAKQVLEIYKQVRHRP
jgi:glycosyltransferase involved in cell wall biosynthesis